MSQSDTTVSTRFSLLPGSITRFFLLLIIVLLVTMGVMVQSAVNAWLKDKSYQIVDITHAIHKRVDTWRYSTKLTCWPQMICVRRCLSSCVSMFR